MIDWSMMITAEQRTAAAALAARKAEVPDLMPDQFWFILRAAGYEDAVRAWVAALNDPDEESYDPLLWAAVSAKLEFATFFERDHPLVEAAREALGIDPAVLDDLWRYGGS